MSIQSQSSRVIYGGYNVTATTNYIYNDSGSNAATSGWFKCKADNIVVQIAVATLTASALWYQIEGKRTGLFTNDRNAAIYSATVTATTTVDTLVNVTESMEYLRVGAYVGNEATPNNFYAGIILTDHN